MGVSKGYGKTGRKDRPVEAAAVNADDYPGVEKEAIGALKEPHVLKPGGLSDGEGEEGEGGPTLSWPCAEIGVVGYCGSHCGGPLQGEGVGRRPGDAGN